MVEDSGENQPKQASTCLLGHTSFGLTAASSEIAGMLRPTRLLDKVEQERAEPKRLLLLHPVTSAVDQRDVSHSRRCLCPHKIERARRRIGAPIALPANEERWDIDCLVRKQTQFGGRPGSDKTRYACRAP